MVFMMSSTYASIDKLQFQIDQPGKSEIEAIILKNLRSNEIELVGEYTRIPFTIFVKNNNDKVIGGISALIRGYDCAIKSVSLEKDYTRKGIGTKMFIELEKFAKENNCKRMIVETFQAKGFYEKLGFKTVATIPQGMLEHDLFILQKIL